MNSNLSTDLPSRPADGAEKLREAMAAHFRPEAQASLVRSSRDALSALGTPEHPVFRPSWYFDLKAIIHPALTIDHDLNITSCSAKLCEFVGPIYPDLEAQVSARKLGLTDFLRGLNLCHFDYDTLEPNRVHVLDPSEKFPGLLTHLADRASVDKKPALLTIGKIEHYLELSFALQIAFPGAQSIWHIVDERVGQMRLIRAMRLTKWFITAHRLKQPTNLFNIARATLELLFERYKQEDVNREYIESELSDVISSLSVGIQEFSRFVKEISGDEYKIATRLGDLESVDVLAALEDVVRDIDFIYARPAGVHLVLSEGCSPGDARHFIHASPFLLREALFNVIHNAFKHGARDATSPSINIRCQCTTDVLIIEVDDNGPGMTARELQEYTRAFEEIRTNVNAGEVGALSGLSLAMSVIKSSNGTISFANLTPKGFRTTLTFNGS